MRFLAAAAIGLLALAARADDEATELPPLEVHPLPGQIPDPLRDLRGAEDRRACPACDPAWFALQPDAADRVGGAVAALAGLPWEPPQLTPEQRQDMRTGNDPFSHPLRALERSPQQRDEER